MTAKHHREPRRLAFRVGLALLCILVPRAGWPCTCVGPRGKASLAGATAVFRGKVLKVERLEPDRGGDHEPKVAVSFEVYRVWKGPLGPRVVVRTVENRWSCSGWSFAEGAEYLVTAYEHLATDPKSRRLTELGGINTCGGTMPALQALQGIGDLGPGSAPSE